MRIMQMTEEKKKIRKEAAAENKPDSTAILRNMMTMMKAKGVGLPDEERMEEEERANRSRHDGDDIKRQRELEIDMMRQARQEALEEEERRLAMERSQPARAVSPSLVAAKNVNA